MNTPERVIVILDELASADGPCSVSELSRQLGIGKVNILRVLTALEEKGWIEHDPETKKYNLTGAMAEVGFQALSRLDIQKITLPYLHELQAATRETSALLVRVEMERMFINCIPSDHEIRHMVPLGKRMPLWYGSGGKCILAFMSENEIETVLSQIPNNGSPALPAGQTISVESLRAELEEIRRQGFSLGSGERQTGTCGVSAPIFNHHQLVIGAIGISGPTTRLDRAKTLEFSTIVAEKARKISIRLGARTK
jgi:IclR family acetate operon transcriptional repressor